MATDTGEYMHHWPFRNGFVPDSFRMPCYTGRRMRDLVPTIGFDTADTPECFASHIGIYAIHLPVLNERVDQIRLHLASERPIDASRAPVVSLVNVEGGDPTLGQEMVAIIPIEGAITKKRSKFAESSAVEIRALVRKMANDPQVSKIVLKIDSPGGAIGGIDDLAAEVRDAAKKKPVIAFIEDMGASAAFWIASQATEIVANRSALVGSLGVYGVITDSSGAADRAGVKVHVISSGGVKGAGIPGTKVTEPQLEDHQRVIDVITDLFKMNVESGRGLTSKEVTKLFDGRVHQAAAALELGLIDRIGSLESTFTEVAEGEEMSEHEDKDKKEGKEKEAADESADKHDPEEDKKREEEEKKKKEEEEEASAATSIPTEAMTMDEFYDDVKVLAKETKEAGCPYSLSSIEAKLKRAGGKGETPEKALELAEAKAKELSGMKNSAGSFADSEDPVAALGETATNKVRSDYLAKWEDLKKSSKNHQEALTKFQTIYPELHAEYVKSYNPTL